MITEGTFETKETIQEVTPHGTFTVTYKKEFTITEENFYGTPRFYQSERTYRNGQITFTAQYPADTDYAKQRRIGVTGW